MALTTVNSGLLDSNAQYTGFKNRIINGAMMIDQRNAGAAVTSGFSVDRFKSDFNVSGKLQYQQVNATAVGFTKAVTLTSLSAYTLNSGDVFVYRQLIEGYNVADLGWGTANAKAVTVSFFVKASVTGSYSFAVGNGAGNRSYVTTFSIPTANTDTYITITIPGDTTGTWPTDNSAGLVIGWEQGASGASLVTSTTNTWQAGGYQKATGTVSLVNTNAATFTITGVQLEKGSTATSFDYRPYGTELSLCQRYCQVLGGQAAYEVFGLGTTYSTTNGIAYKYSTVAMRAVPSLSYSSLSDWNLVLPGIAAQVATALAINGDSSTTLVVINVTYANNASFGGSKAAALQANNTTNARITLSSEL